MKLHLIFTSEGINPTPWNLETTIDSLIREKVKEIKFVNPLVLDYIRVLIQENILIDSNITMDITNDKDEVIKCKFIDKMWTTLDYKDCCKDLDKTYPTNTYLNVHMELLMKLV
jgi:hypothetical protein